MLVASLLFRFVVAPMGVRTASRFAPRQAFASLHSPVHLQRAFKGVRQQRLPPIHIQIEVVGGKLQVALELVKPVAVVRVCLQRQEVSVHFEQRLVQRVQVVDENDVDRTAGEVDFCVVVLD